MDPFKPVGATTKTATTTSAAHPIPGGANSVEKTVRVVREANGNRVWVKFGSVSSATVASSDGIELLPGVVEIFELAVGEVYFSIICNTGTVDVNVTVGQGL